MALFKALSGVESNIPSELTDGYVYFCNDTGNVFYDYIDSSGNLCRSKLYAEANAQSDWNQADAEASDYIKNRPCYKEENADVYSGTFTTAMDDGLYMAINQIDNSYVEYMVVGETYTVTVNNTEYNCVLLNGYELVLGNSNIWYMDDYDTGEPFAIAINPYMGIALATEEPGTYTVTITGPITKTIDYDFIPQLDYVRQEDIYEYVHKSEFSALNSSLTYKGQTYDVHPYEYFMFFLTDDGIWKIQSNFGSYKPGSGELRMNYASATGTLELYYTDNRDFEWDEYFNAYRYDISNGQIVQRVENTTSVTIGQYTKKSHNFPFYTNKNIPQWEKITHSFDEFIEIPFPTMNDNGKILGVVNGAYEMVNPSGGGTSDYTDLSNKPKINNIELSGNKTASDLGLASSGHSHSYNDLTNKPTAYSLPTASSMRLGGVKPVTKTSAMTQDVGVDSTGKLYTAQASGGSTTLSSLGITATATELNYVDGVTSSIQTQLNGKSATNHTHTAVNGYTISVVNSLPLSPNANTIYFVKGG